ncbi:SPARC-related modular calcium-binding protein 1 [Phytophthora oleae]|uniref:SPARC-related modular calcium-binding protein 1 n=1 Tax=Phytophthora oleae TaxID=2107226 RepID=A0ABD3FD52_9STRA
MKFAIVSVLVSLLIAGTSAQGFSCAGVGNIGCDGDDGTAGPQVCASNGITYTNRCYFNKANCDNKGLRVLHNGMCRRDGTR